MTDSVTLPPAPLPAAIAATVVAVTDLSPSFRRVKFVAAEFIQADPGAAATIDLRFSAAGPGAAAGSGATPRAFTMRDLDPLTGEFDVDFLLHAGGGVAAAWARAAAPGQTLALLGPRGDGGALPADATQLVLAGDAAALPAIEVLLGRLAPRQAADVLLEVPTLADVRALTSRAALNVEWVVASETDPRPLSAAVRKLPAANVDFWWAACESGLAREILTHLQEERGVPAARTRVTPYWRAGLSEEEFRGERDAATWPSDAARPL